MESKRQCKKCGKVFLVRVIYYGSKVDNKRESYISCPYCGEICEKILLSENQDIVELKI